MQPEILIFSSPISAWRFSCAEASEISLSDRDGAGRCERAVIHAGAGNDVGDQTGVAFGNIRCDQLVEQSRKVVQFHMRQDYVLLVGNTDFILAVPFGKIRNHVHLRVGRIARDATDRLHREGNGCIARHPVRIEIVGQELRKGGVRLTAQLDISRDVWPDLERRRCKISLDPAHFVVRQAQNTVADLFKFALDIRLQIFQAGLVHEDLDPRLVLVVPAAVAGCRRAGLPRR
jgi:hypothetical protein